MPSQAYTDFLDAIDEVNRFFDSHKLLSPLKPDQGALTHITGSCVVALGASWERYIKSVLIIAVDFVQTAGLAKSPTKLPASIQDSINKILKESHDFKPLELAEDGWCKFYNADAMKAIDKFHSQKPEPVADLFKKYIGIAPNELFNCWCVAQNGDARKRIDQIAEVRNRLVHADLKKGERLKSQTGHLELQTVWQYKIDIMTIVRETDNFLHEKLQSFSPVGSAPWKKAAKLTKREVDLLNYKGLPGKDC